MSSDQIQTESDFYARWKAAPPAISGRAWVKRDLDFWHRCTIDRCAGSRVTVLMDNMDEWTVERDCVSAFELEPGDVVFYQAWDRAISGYAAVVISVNGESAEIEFPASLYREGGRQSCLLRDLRLYCDLIPTEWRKGTRVFAYKVVPWRRVGPPPASDPRSFLLFPARVQAVHFGVCVEVELVDGESAIVPTTLVENLDVSEGDLVYTCTSFVSHGTHPEEKWGPCRVLERDGENLAVQDGAGEQFDTRIGQIAVLPKGYRMIDGRFERIPDNPVAGNASAVHIVRTDHWRNAADDPITRAQMDELIGADPELAWSIADWGQANRDLGASPILWNGQPCFWWQGNEIRCAEPSEAQLAKMIDIAVALDANVIGDDGTEFH